MSVKIFERTDSSGLVTTAVFRQEAPAAAAHFFDLRVDVAGDMVVVGGGATAAEAPNGALLTASYPSDDRSAWLASSRITGSRTRIVSSASPSACASIHQRCRGRRS